MSGQQPDDKLDISYEDLFGKIGEDDFVDFMLEKNIKVECELCSSNIWVFEAFENNEIPVIPIHAKNSGPTFNSLEPLFSVYCDNCGNKRIFNRPTVLKWKRDRAKRS